MPRQARKMASSNIYHCMLRGINQQEIFLEKKDYLQFQEIMRNTKEKFSYKLYSYVLMPNHVHLEIKDENKKISQIIHSIATSYAIYFNKKYQRRGHLFENRFKSRNVENPYYIYNLVRYIHQNPEKAGICEMKNYQWSSYGEYFSNSNIISHISTKEKNTIVDTEDILKIYSDNYIEDTKSFLEFNHEKTKFKESTELLEYEMRGKLTDVEIIYFIKRKLNISNLQEIQKYDEENRNIIIQQIKKIPGSTQVQIARVLGITRKIVQRA